jgi:hypothetical protein
VHAEPPTLDTLAAMLSRSGRPVYLIGEGIPYHNVPDEAGVIITPPELWVGQAEVVARIGFEMARAGQFTDPLALTPLYIRLPEAEEKRLSHAVNENTSPKTHPGPTRRK